MPEGRDHDGEAVPLRGPDPDEALRALLQVRPDGEPISHPSVIEVGTWRPAAGDSWVRVSADRIAVKKVDRAVRAGLPLLHIVGTRETLLTGDDAEHFWTSVRPYYVYDGAQPHEGQSEFAAAEFRSGDDRMIVLQEYLS